jgi:hypothetical protein
MKSSPHVTVFEAAIIADSDAQSAVERELGLLLASLLWRLRRATTMENGLFEIQAHHLSRFRQTRYVNSREDFDRWSRDLANSGVAISARAWSRACSFRSRVTLREGVYGQHRGLSCHSSHKPAPRRCEKISIIPRYCARAFTDATELGSSLHRPGIEGRITECRHLPVEWLPRWPLHNRNGADRIRR